MYDSVLIGRLEYGQHIVKMTCSYSKTVKSAGIPQLGHPSLSLD